ncbi:unnamed protein product [Bemisia tabaci]|uniref:Uncharacterized protein n=1 Tax=Bemisia tabaci TaxID=7038 RepID=A0A9P0CAX9_BEMTA|nr:unnamed protein product [Bemisia tabaci]
MRNNLVTLIAQSDPLILEVGQRFFESHRLPKHVKQVRKIIRDLARLYIAVDEIQDEEEEGGTCIESSQMVKDLTDCIDPLKFDIVAKALQALAGYDAKTGAVKVASVSGRYSNPLKICADVLLSNAYQSKTLLESDKNAIKEKMQKWLHVLRFEWQYKIGSICETSRKINVASKEEVIPLDEDIRKLSLQVESLYPVTIEMLKKEKSATNFVALCRLIIVDIILLCRRRPTEVCHATLLAYSKVVFQDEKEANADYLTDADKKVGGLLKIF